jgi:hypothetical protein
VNELAVVPSTAKELPIRRKALRLGKAAIWRHHTVPIHLVCHPVHTGVSNRASTQIQSESSRRFRVWLNGVPSKKKKKKLALSLFLCSSAPPFPSLSSFASYTGGMAGHTRRGTPGHARP